MAKRKLYISIMAVLLLLCSVSSSFAGNINSNEAWIVSEASGTFPYKGVVYVASDESMGMLMDYLLRDDIDITEDEAHEAVALMYDNVERGVLEGYIIPVTGTEKPQQVRPESSITIEKDQAGSSVTIEKDGKKVFEGSTPVKNTGLSLNITFIFAGLIAVCIVISAVLFRKAGNENEQI